MDQASNYIVDSLELNLFFARIMKEHALFLKVGFQPPGAGLAREGDAFLRQFEALLSRAITLSDRAVREQVLRSGELVTEFTAAAERQTQALTGTPLNRGLTARTARLNGFCGPAPDFSCTLQNQVRRLNRDALALVNRLIAYKEGIIRRLNACSLFTANYPLLVEHILREAYLYRDQLRRLEGLEQGDCEQLCDNAWFWNRIMMEHALFIRGLLDPTEEDLIHSANGFAGDYRRLLDAANSANDMTVQPGTAQLTLRFRDFKRAGVEGIEACRIQSLILPLLADHVLREANRYLRLLGE